MKKLTVAQRAWLAAICGLLIVETYCAATGQQLLSEAVWDCEGTAPWVALAAGIGIGHFFCVPAKFMRELEGRAS